MAAIAAPRCWCRRSGSTPFAWRTSPCRYRGRRWRTRRLAAAGTTARVRIARDRRLEARRRDRREPAVVPVRAARAGAPRVGRIRPPRRLGDVAVVGRHVQRRAAHRHDRVQRGRPRHAVAVVARRDDDGLVGVVVVGVQRALRPVQAVTAVAVGDDVPGLGGPVLGGRHRLERVVHALDQHDPAVLADGVDRLDVLRDLEIPPLRARRAGRRAHVDLLEAGGLTVCEQDGTAGSPKAAL